MPYAGPAPKRQRKQAYPKRRKLKVAARSDLILRPIIPTQENVFSTTRRYRLGLHLIPNIPVTDNGGYQAVYGLQINLVDIPNWAEYTSIFDSYRITGAEVEFQPRVTEIDTTSTSSLCTLGWFQDQNNVSLTGLSGLENPWLERTGYRQTLLDKVVKVKYTPRPLQMVYDGVTATGYQTGDSKSMNEWIACTFNSVPHNGLLFRVYAPTATAALGADMVQVYVNVSLQFKATR